MLPAKSITMATRYGNVRVTAMTMMQTITPATRRSAIGRIMTVTVVPMLPAKSITMATRYGNVRVTAMTMMQTITPATQRFATIARIMIATLW
jgi:hypothetical protein